MNKKIISERNMNKRKTNKHTIAIRIKCIYKALLFDTATNAYFEYSMSTWRKK